MFKARFVPLIIDGSKTQTIRARSTIRAGDLIQARNRYSDPAFAVLRATAVKRVKVSELSEADAAADGFASLDELTQTLKQLYPKLSSERELFCIQFEYMGSLEQIRAALDRQGSLALGEP